MAAWAGCDAFEDVLTSARMGDERAFAVLWRWLQPALLRWLTVISPGTVEDVASEVWLTVMQGLDSFVGDEGDFRGWVFTIARRRSIDGARRRARQPHATALGDTDVVDPAAASSLLVDAATSIATALAMLQRLTPDQREVLSLRVIVGMTVAETAAVVNKTEGAVRVLCHRGLRTMAGQLQTAHLARGVTA